MAHRTIRRRDFLRLTVVSATAVGALPVAGCGTSSDGPGTTPADSGVKPASPADVLRVFPQGLASGDPKPDSVILWTRVEPAKSAAADVEVAYEVATDKDFKKVIARGALMASAAADHTLRIKVTKLDAFTTYYYRFLALEVWSDVGRTKTAPKDDADEPVRFAFAACQDFAGRHYHAWKALADDDAVDFVLHLGDYIYETAGDPAFQTPTDDRKIVLPDGLEGKQQIAATLADYRSLYKQYRSDPSLRRVHQMYPFIVIWDDHEFGDDCWQDHNTHYSGAQGLEQVTAQREDADQAWFEFQPADVEWDEAASFPDDIRIYRNLRYGKHLELFLTDQRYYRDAHLIPPGPLDSEVGKILENSAVGSRIFLLKSGFDVKEAVAKPSMLGATQKAWFLKGVKASTATWKIWGSEVQLAQMVADLSSFPKLPATFQNKMYLTVDQWDGYRSERAEILGELKDVENLVVVTGDIHAFYASELHVDFDAPGAVPIAPEYVVAGITSQAIAPAATSVIGSNDIFKAVGLLDLIPRWDELLQAASPHYKYANSFVNGIAVCSLTPEAAEVTFIIVGDVTDANDDAVAKRVKFRTPAGSRKVELV